MVELIKHIFMGLGLGVLGVLVLFLFYTVVRILFSAIFRSYFEQKHKTGGKSNEEE